MGGHHYGGRSAGSSSLLLGAIRVEADDRLAPLLILAGLVIAVTGAITVVYQCGSAAGWTSASLAPAALSHQQVAALLAAKQPDKLYYGPPPLNIHHYQQQQHHQQQMTTPNGAQTPIDTLTGSLRFNSIQDPYAFRAAFHSLAGGGGCGGALTPTADSPHRQPLVATNQQQQQQQQQPLPPINSKEYETQMLKMSVLFDDNHSLDERNLNENQISTKNLV